MARTPTTAQDDLHHDDHDTLLLERRRGVRVEQRRPVKLLDPRTGRYHGAVTLDVSGTGLKLSIPRTLPVLQGTVLHLHVAGESQGLISRSQMVPVRIVWLRGEVEKQAGVELLATPTAAVEAA